jgi:hypothetical protein
MNVGMMAAQTVYSLLARWFEAIDAPMSDCSLQS